MKPVPVNTIPNHYDTQKLSVGMIVICNDEVLVNKDELQGIIIYNTFGTFFNGDNHHEQIMTVQKEQLGTSYDVDHHGEMIEYIHKPPPDGRVQLTAYVYTLPLNEEQKSRLNLKDNQFWVSKKEIQESDAIREDDKIIFERLFNNEHINIVMDVDQMGKWIDAKLLAWGVLDRSIES